MDIFCGETYASAPEFREIHNRYKIQSKIYKSNPNSEKNPIKNQIQSKIQFNPNMSQTIFTQNIALQIKEKYREKF